MDLEWTTFVNTLHGTHHHKYLTKAIVNPMPNAHVCVYLTVHITKLQLQTTFPKPFYIPHG